MERDLQPHPDLLLKFPEFDKEFAKLLLEFLESKGPATFAELSSCLVELCVKDGDAGYEWTMGASNVVIWSNFTYKAICTLVHLKKWEIIELDPCPSLYYLMDGIMSRYPVAKRPPSNGYTKPHWVPTVLKIKK
jgi:hypothetical protein